MTTEEDFQAALDANPDDWQTRLVFADWLQERGDPRAEGCGALGALHRSPACWRAHEGRPYPLWGWLKRSRTDIGAEEILPDDWYALIARDGPNDWYARIVRNESDMILAA